MVSLSLYGQNSETLLLLDSLSIRLTLSFRNGIRVNENTEAICLGLAITIPVKNKLFFENRYRSNSKKKTKETREIVGKYCKPSSFREKITSPSYQCSCGWFALRVNLVEPPLLNTHSRCLTFKIIGCRSRRDWHIWVAIGPSFNSVSALYQLDDSPQINETICFYGVSIHSSL